MAKAVDSFLAEVALESWRIKVDGKWILQDHKSSNGWVECRLGRGAGPLGGEDCPLCKKAI